MMSSIHNNLSSLDLRKRRNAQEYQSLYSDLKGLAKQYDNNHEVDRNPRAGEVHLQETEDSVQVNLGYAMDQGYTGERLSVLQTEIKPDGKVGHKVSLRAKPVDRDSGLLRFELWEYEGVNISPDSHQKTVLVDTKNGTVFVEQKD